MNVRSTWWSTIIYAIVETTSGEKKTVDLQPLVQENQPGCDLLYAFFSTIRRDNQFESALLDADLSTFPFLPSYRFYPEKDRKKRFLLD